MLGRFRQTSPSKIGNALSVINGLAPLDGSNYPSWREKLMMALTMADIDHAIETPRPTPPVLAAQDIPAAADNLARQMSYDLEKAKRERPNKKCFMDIKKTLIPSIQGAIPECESATEYLQKIKDQFTGSTKAYAGALIKKFANAECDGSGIREYIFETFIVNYNISAEKWTIEKCIAMCVQEKERNKAQKNHSPDCRFHSKRTLRRVERSIRVGNELETEVDAIEDLLLELDGGFSFILHKEPFFSIPTVVAAPVVAAPVSGSSSAAVSEPEAHVVTVVRQVSAVANEELEQPLAGESSAGEPVQEPVRRSQRNKRSAISADYEVCVNEDADTEGDPTSFEEAMRDPHSSKWLATMEDEMRSMSTNKLWDLEEISKGAKTIKGKNVGVDLANGSETESVAQLAP
ncbi:hypothetical protein U9M48_005421 [Paspalum notatum var. saurae]|uniref:Uncharacterized protein n=1 Tax=Paspalum notatum var. saurae TaxID=547442 RepID=A0AAQ3PQT4_PASNO